MSTHGTVLTENKLETDRKTYTTKVVRKIHTESHPREGKKSYQILGTASLGEDAKVGNDMGSDMLLGE